MRVVMRVQRGVPGLLPVLCLSILVGCPTSPPDDFVSISEHGFDAADNAQDKNDYPWSMGYFVPDGDDSGWLYVGTGNNIIQHATSSATPGGDPQPFYRPPEIRRYRLDLGAKTWERVFDYRDVEDGPPWETSGFRSMAVYRARTDDINYLYAGTFGAEPALWRSAAGESGTWERVWSSPEEGSIRALAEHNGLLYVAVSHDQRQPVLPAEIYATDGDTVWSVVDDSFGGSGDSGIYSLASFNGWLWAGTSNREEGFDVWKLEGPDGDERIQVVADGGPSPSNQSTTQMVVFKDRLYIASLLLGGLNLHGFLLRGADMIRIDADDNVETVVGPGSLGGVESGFGVISNGYLWSLVEHDGRLYCGTWDSASIIPLITAFPADVVKVLLGNVLNSKSVLGPYDMLTCNGAGLYVSDDGVHWESLFTDGLGNPDNYGIRNMASVDGVLYLGMANPFEGLEIWKSTTDNLQPR